MLNKKLILTILGGLVLYLTSTAISYAGFRYLSKPVEIPGVSTLPQSKSGFRVDLSAPKTEECPLNGGMFTKDERKIWEQHRPLTVMIENHQDSRPQSGLSRADVIYEAVAEGGITRFLAVFYCGVSASDYILGPIRSARIYYINWASEYGKEPIYVHVGGANNFCPDCPGRVKPPGTTAEKVRAIEFLEKIGWRRGRVGNDFDAGSNVGFPTVWRDYERLGHPVATEHTYVGSSDKLWEEASKRDLSAVDSKNEKWDELFTLWKFKDEAKLEKRGEVKDINFGFWSGMSDYEVNWQYDKEGNHYSRFNGGGPHKDHNNDEQLKAKVVVIQFIKEEGPVDKEKHIFYNPIGEGKAIVFQDGQAAEASWRKKDRESRTLFFDLRSKEIKFNRGQIWIEIVPAHQNVKY